MKEKALPNIEDSGAGFELTESQFHDLGEKQAEMLSVHKNGQVKRVSQEEPFEPVEMVENNNQWYRRRSFDPFTE